jgi:hypothetical protein
VPIERSNNELNERLSRPSSPPRGRRCRCCGCLDRSPRIELIADPEQLGEHDLEVIDA